MFLLHGGLTRGNVSQSRNVPIMNGSTRMKAAGVFLLAALLSALVIGARRATSVASPPVPGTTLICLGLTNLPPLGTMTAFAVSNGNAFRLLYDPRMVEYRASTGTVRVSSETIVDRVGVVGPGKTHVFFVPGSVTNQSLRVRMESRAKAESDGLLMKLELLVKKVSSGSSDAWLGQRYEGILTATNR